MTNDKAIICPTFTRISYTAQTKYFHIGTDKMLQDLGGSRYFRQYLSTFVLS
jgi:hypothetical protein